MNIPPRIFFRLPRAAALAAALALLAALPSAARADSGWTWDTFDSLMTVARDPAKGSEISALARELIAGATGDSADVFLGRSLLYQISRARHAPVERIASDADSLLLACGPDGELRAARARMMAYELGDEPRTRPLAMRMAREAVAAARTSGGDAQTFAATEVALGWTHLQNGAADSAVVWLEDGVRVMPDSAAALSHFSRALELSGNDQRALEAGIRSLAIYQASDTSAAPRVRALWRKSHGSPRGLSAALEDARAVARRRALIESSRVDLPPPESELLTAEGDTLRLADHLGHVVVLEYWGSWSGACARALPRIQSLFGRYRTRGVVFFGVNVEHTGDRAAWLDRMHAVIKEHHLTFTMIPDFTGLAVLSCLVDSFPTTVLVDKAGRIRFKHSLSASADGEAILSEQIESLLK